MRSTLRALGRPVISPPRRQRVNNCSALFNGTPIATRIPGLTICSP
ncbi:hypothetical protein KCP69_01440 [Salmonella enterica subsp. enterica]|nr:hypothetical protein KCP69_01440 [Salmonella enterica subsp. enterica]